MGVVDVALQLVVPSIGLIAHRAAMGALRPVLAARRLVALAVVAAGEALRAAGQRADELAPGVLALRLLGTAPRGLLGLFGAPPPPFFFVPLAVGAVRFRRGVVDGR